MTIQIPVRIAEEDLSELDVVIEHGRYPNRSAALRAALKLLLRAEREREITEAYRRGYGEHPQEVWVGEAGLASFAALVEAEEKDLEPL
jgi:Arc/MetJ-type ribon-helix-helix transcriptional regulator